MPMWLQGITMPQIGQKIERRAKRGKKKLPPHVRRSASQLERVEGIIRTLLSPYTQNIKIYPFRSHRRGKKKKRL